MAYGETRIQTQLSFMGLDGYCYYVGGVYMPFYSAWKICIFAGLDSFSADNGGKVIVCLYYYS
ncbi:hypothetical protein CE91St6_35010 [Phocaeicola dorei]|uniref:Uncharacterized protein n=1 Tax=Phocaeicola dorei TaxID=357276 RepID=A0AA37NNW9_9BACT|nr:hypothetical protein CE91St6_35010 [Phocaeicola dorei]GKH82620.1 hypothetical protein CE91St7_35040 [Phocaeicola dorei]